METAKLSPLVGERGCNLPSPISGGAAPSALVAAADNSRYAARIARINTSQRINCQTETNNGSTPKTHITVAEYLAGERKSRIKHEYFAGDVFAMAGASKRRNLIAANTLASLHAQLRKRSYSVYSSAMRVVISRTGLYTYPDVAVVCGEAKFEDQHRDTLLNPTVIVEVLSPSTESYDRSRKFQHYRQFDSLQEVVLIAQDTWHVELYRRQTGGGWLLTEATDLDTRLLLSSIQCELALVDIYEKVTISEGEG